jgi:hypothetical protein
MSGPGPSLLVRAVEGWVACYTRGLLEAVRDARRAELRSDLHQHLRQAAGDGHGRLRVWLQVLGRVVRGMPDDLAWRFAQRAPAPRRQLLAWLFDWQVTPAAVLGVLVSTWFSTSPVLGAVALLVLFVVLAVLRMRLVGPISNEAALMFGLVPGGCRTRKAGPAAGRAAGQRPAAGAHQGRRGLAAPPTGPGRAGPPRPVAGGDRRPRHRPHAAGRVRAPVAAAAAWPLG